MLMMVCAEIISFCAMFAFLMQEWNDSGSRNAAPFTTRGTESE
jgi:hypothetical protein